MSDAQSADHYFSLAEVFLNQGRIDRGLEMLDRAAGIEPDAPQGWHLRAVAHMRRDDRQAAHDAARRLIELCPDQALAYYTLGCVLAQTDQDDALAAARLAVTLDPLDDDHQRLLAYVAPAGSEEARQAAEETLRLAPDDPCSHAVCAEIAIDERCFDEAQLHINNALRIDPTNEAALAARNRLALVRVRSFRSVAGWLGVMASSVRAAPHDQEGADTYRTALVFGTVGPPLVTAFLGLVVVPPLWFGQWVNPGRILAGGALLLCLVAFWRVWASADQTVRGHVRAALTSRVSRDLLVASLCIDGLLLGAVASPAARGWVFLAASGGVVVAGLGRYYVLDHQTLFDEPAERVDVWGTGAFLLMLAAVVWVGWAAMLCAALAGGIVFWRVVLAAGSVLVVVGLVQLFRSA